MRSDRATNCRKEAAKPGQSTWARNLEERGTLFQDGRKSMKWHYDRAEILADGLVHGLGIAFGLVAVTALALVAIHTVAPLEFASIMVYGAGLLTVLIVSAVYNLWPISPVKWILRRFDHSAIYLLIAGTYTPFFTQMKLGIDSILLIASVWITSIIGIVLKLTLPGRFERLSIVLYLLVGWSGVMAYDAVFNLPSSTLWLIAAGGVLYSAGVIFHLWESLRFQNAIWHAFVLAAAICHYGAVLDCMVLSRA
jgi:hemolysin III